MLEGEDISLVLNNLRSGDSLLDASDFPNRRMCIHNECNGTQRVWAGYCTSWCDVLIPVPAHPSHTFGVILPKFLAANIYTRYSYNTDWFTNINLIQLELMTFNSSSVFNSADLAISSTSITSIILLPGNTPSIEKFIQACKTSLNKLQSNYPWSAIILLLVNFS